LWQKRLTEAKIWSADLVHLKGFGFLLCRSMKELGLELPDGGVDTSPDLLSGEFSEPALDRPAARAPPDRFLSCKSMKGRRPGSGA
jgi:hypothetical protein